jgi:hypothetical protein
MMLRHSPWLPNTGQHRILARFGRPGTSRAALLVLPLALAAAFHSGCAGGGGPPVQQAAVADANFYSETTRARRTSDTTPDDGILDGALEVTAEPVVELQLDDQGRASLPSLEKIARTALSLAAEGRLNEAQDHLYVLEDQAALPAPVDADSLYLEQMLSLQRRAGFWAPSWLNSSPSPARPAWPIRCWPTVTPVWARAPFPIRWSRPPAPRCRRSRSIS